MPWEIPQLTSGELKTIHDRIESGAENDATYRDSVRKIFGDGVSLGSRGGKCAYCHGPGNETGLDLSNPFDPVTGARSVPAVRGGIRIVPGDAEASVLYQRVDPDLIPAHLEPLMPRQADRITPEEADVIRTWILQGALDN